MDDPLLPAAAAPPARTIRDGLTKDTVLCLSLSARPSNNGTRFHNFLYDALGLDVVYKAFAPGDLAGAVAGIRALGVRGAGVSMPFKEAVIDLVDVMTPSATAIASVNTLVNDTSVPGGHLTAHNTDYTAVRELVEGAAAADATLGGLLPVVAGSGGMAKACVAALRDAGWGRGLVLARNQATGGRLADAYGWTWVRDLADLAGDPPGVLVNATPVGMAGGREVDALPFPLAVVRAASLVLDVVASPDQTPLVRAATAAGVRVITGGRVATLQALEQFVLYTGVRPDDDLVAAAAAFARPA